MIQILPLKGLLLQHLQNSKPTMDIDKVFHMTAGIGNSSYNKNSSLQKKASDMVKHITMEAIQQVYLSTDPKSFGLADLGCSSGLNSLSTIKDIIEGIQALSCGLRRPAPEFRVYLNDLPTNDFNTIFKALPEFCSDLKSKRNGSGCGYPAVFIGGYPGSFYHRLFPNSCLHFVYSSYSLHWLSRVPPGIYSEEGEPMNKGTIYISESSPDVISEAYQKQFHQDFSLFLKNRSPEMVAGGRMVLILLGRKGSGHFDRGNSFLWQLLARSFAILVSQGEIKQEKLDSYDVHFYAPSKEEVEEEVRREGSFGLERLEVFEIEKNVKNSNGDLSYGTTLAMTVRAIQESMISSHFGDGILDILFDKYASILDEEMAIQEIKPTSLAIVLTKL